MFRLATMLLLPAEINSNQWSNGTLLFTPSWLAMLCSVSIVGKHVLRCSSLASNSICPSLLNIIMPPLLAGHSLKCCDSYRFFIHSAGPLDLLVFSVEKYLPVQPCQVMFSKLSVLVLTNALVGAFSILYSPITSFPFSSILLIKR